MSGNRTVPPAILKKPRRPGEPDPLEVRLSLRFCFGDKPGETVCVMQDRRVPMVDSVLKSRDRILSSFTTLLLRASLAQPKLARELAPLLSALGVTRRRRSSRN